MNPRIARQVDLTTREITELLAAHAIRLTPAIIEELRVSVARAVLSATPRHAGVVPRTGPWDEETTEPQLPSAKRRAATPRPPPRCSRH